MDNNRKQALAAALQQIERQFGKGAIMRMGDGTAAEGIGVVSTGSLTLDTALGIGGLPRGRVVEVYGPESSGKTTLTLHAIAECQKMGGTTAFVDAEHALDPIYRAGPGNHRHAGALRRGGHGRGRLGGGAHAESRNRGRHG
jgi:recombination protein RecA